MLLLLSWIALPAAHAGPMVQVMAGGALPVAKDTDSSSGALLGLIGGYRAKVGPVALQPEAVVRYNLDASTLAVGAGGEVTFGMAGPLRVGPYAHIGTTVVPAPAPSPDAGLSIVINPPTPVIVGARVGWQWDHPTQLKCDNCAQPAEHWLTAAITAGAVF